MRIDPGHHTLGKNIKIVYLILAHNSPAHLKRLVMALATPDCACLIHIDARADLALFGKIAAPHVSLTRERAAVHWGDFSQVAATRILMREALASPARYDRFVLLSGVDYPLHPPGYLSAFFTRHARTEFIDLAKMPCAASSKPLSRLTDYQPGPARTALAALQRRLRRRFGIAPRQRDYRQALGGLQPYAGATWWALTRDACEYIETFIKDHAQFVEFFRNTVCPDEMFIHTILGNSPFSADVQRDLTYADWSAQGASPASLTLDHIDLFHHGRIFPDGGEMLFARKFSDDRAFVTDALALFLSEQPIVQSVSMQ